MAVTIEIQDRRKTAARSLPELPHQIQTLLKAEGVRQGRLSVVFVTDRTIRSLNRRFLQEDRPTDVLAFDFTPTGLSYQRKPGSPVRLIDGEIVISTTTARRQARIYRTLPTAELLLYVIHGVLHLVGYDDHRPAEVKRMRAREQAWLSRLQTAGPAPARRRKSRKPTQ